MIGHTVSGADYGSVTAASVDVTVDDDETASSGVTLTVVPESVSEGANATTVTVTAGLNGGTRGDATPVAVTVGSGTAESGTDFAAVAGFTISIPANTQSHTGTFSLGPTQDTVDEPDETISVAGTTTVPGFSVTGAAVEIIDDDASPTVTLSLSDASIGEDAGVATVRASLSHGSSVVTTVTVSVSPDGPAVAGDYSISANKSLTIAAEATSSTGAVTITGVDNDVDAVDKTVQVQGAAVNSLGVTGPADVELTLEDDDARGVAVSKTDLDIAEGGDGDYTVVLTSEPTGQVTVTPSRSSGDTDVTVSGAVTFTAGNWSTARTVTVSAGQDTDAADDTAVIGHTVSGADYGSVTAASVDVTVDDDETASSGVILTVVPESVSEGAGATTVTVTAGLNGGTRGDATPVAVTVGSGTAESGTDFAAVAGFTISIPANTQSHTGTFSLSPTQDTVDEPDETVSVAGTTTVPGFSVTGAAVEIIDDDATPTVTLTLSDASIGEDGGSTTVTASLSHASSVATAITVSASPVSPAVASDYSLSANKVLTIAAEATSSTGAVTITGVDNDVDAVDKTVQVQGAAVNSLGVTGPADVELTLEDDDARGVTVSKTDLDIAEGGDGDYTVVLTSEPTGQVTVTPSRSSGDTDVTVSGAVMFTAGNWSTARTVTVSAGQDSDAADDTAVIGHTVSGADYGSVTAASVDVTVDDDETASSGVILTVVPESVSEGAGATTVTVTAGLNGGTRGDATPVAVTVGSGTAESGTDFAAVAGFTISIPANTQSHTGTFSLGPTQDTVDEPDETISVAGTTTVPGFSVTGATVEIIDDDASPTVTLSLSDASIGEDAGVATVRASLSHGSSVVTTVTVSVSPDAPATSSDYSLSANKVLTIAAEATSSTGAVTITGVDNDVDAVDKTVQVQGAAVNSLGVTGPADVELTLEDDDARGVTVSKTDLDIAEGGDGDYTVVLTSEPTGQVTVTPSRSSGDTDVTVSGAVTFTAGNWSTARTVTVSAGQDTDAADDTAVIGHTVSGADYGSVTAASVDVTVDDDETASSGVTLTVVPESVSEGANATTVTVTAGLNGGTRGDATPVAVTVGSGTAESGTDFAAVAGFTISIPANTQSHTGTFSLSPTQDTVDEPDETISVAGTTTVPGFSVTGAAVEIIDDDASPTVTLSLSDASIGEDAGVATVMASLSHGSSVVTTVTVSVSPDGPAVAGDYSISANKSLTIAAEATDSTGAVTITGVDNDVDAADKTVQVQGAAVNSLGVTGPADVELTLEDDDTRGVTVSKTDLDIAEGGDGDYTVVLTSEPTGQVTVTPSRSSGDTDVTVSGAVTFTAGNWSTARTVTVSAGQDTDAADDTAVIGHTVSGADYGSVTAASVDVTVDDDETASSGVILTVVPESVSEGAGATTVTVTAGLNGGTRGDATPVAVTVGSGTAESGTDFAAVAGFTISIPANTQSHTGTFSLSPTQDTVDEPDETVSVAGTTTVPGFSVTGAAVEIIDDDATPTVTLTLSDASIGEDGGSTTVTASLSHASSVATAITVSASPVSPAVASDYSLSANKVLTIAAEATSSTGAVTITAVDNDVDAVDKTVQVQGAAVNSLGVTGPSDVELTLEDDDTRGVTVSKTDLDIAEGGDGDYTVVLTSEPTGQVTVTPSRSSGDPDVTVSGAVTFTAGNWSTARTVTVSAGQDSDAADDTAVIGHTVSGADYGSVTAASVDVTVDDDETASSGVTLTVVPESVSEGANATTVTVTAGLNGGTRGDATPVAVTVGSGTAESGTDFAAVAGFTISIPANTQSHTGTFSLSPTQDTVDEPDETVSVAGTTTVPGFSVTGAAVEIVDDDATPTVTLTLSDASIGEDGGSTTVTASLSHASSVATAITVSASPVSPAVASDYSLSANKVLTIAAEVTDSTGAVTITAVDNDVDAVDKTVQVKGATSNTFGISGPADVELTLEDDDTRGVTVSKTDLDIAEGGDGDYTVVLTSEPTGQVTVTPSRSSGDTDVTVSGAVTFTAGNWSTARTVTVSAGQDSDAADDTAVIGHTVSGADYGSVTAASVDVTVDDDETASSGVTLTVVPESVSEGANATTVTVTAGLNGGTRGDATPVAVTVGSGTAESGTDFAAVAGFTISIPANTQSHTGTFSLGPTQDTVDEPDETVSVAGTTTVPGFSVTGATVEIVDDDATPTVTLTLSDASIGEDGGSTTVTASLSHASSVATAITVSASPVSPAVASDYSLSANKVLTIAAEATSSTGAVTITAVDNDVDAVDKTVQVQGAAVNSLGVTGPADVELTLEDDDTRGVTVSKTDLDIAEGGDGDYTVVLTSEPTGQVTVTPSRSSGDTDVTVSGAVTFTAGNWSTARTVTVSAGQDTDAADDTAVIGHTVSGADYGSVTAASVDVTVDDDETASSGVILTVVPESVSEGAGATTVTVTAGLNGGTRGDATPVAVTVGSGTAESGTDFAAVAGFTISIPANTQSHTGTFSLGPTQDTVDEPDETISVAGTTTVPGFSVTGATVEIIDDDASPTVTIPITDVDEPPDAPTSPTVSAVSGSTTSLSVSWAAPGNAGKPAIANYDVQYRLGSSGAWTDGPQDVTGTTTTITSLATDTAYQARVRATNAEGDSGWSDPPGSGRTNAPSTSVPGAPGNLRTAPGDGRVTLAWTAPGSDGGAAIEKYRYRVSANAGSSWDPDWTDVPDGADTGDSAADETTFTVSGLINGTEYVFELRAVNSVGEGRAASAADTPVRAPLPPGSGFLVGNFGQPADGAAQIYVTHDIVGVFTTGARGADLHNIELRLFTRRPNIAVLPIPSVTLYRASVTDSRATRGARVAALTAVAGSRQPANTAQTVAFAAPSGTRLDAGATYLVVLEHTSYVRVESTTFPAEDAGGAPGWAIDGIGAGNNSPYSYETTASLLMRVNGTVAGAPVTTAPEAPASLGARAGNAEVTLRWAPPRSDGGAGIEKYQVRYSAGSRVDPETGWTDVPDGSDSGTSVADERSVSVTGLDNGRQYAFELRAVNRVRAGAAATAPATPAAPPRSGFLVSNFGQPVDGAAQIYVTKDIVGVFTTGALGATLDSIELRLFTRRPNIAVLPIPSVTLYRGSVTDTRATPGTRVATLTAVAGSRQPANTAQTVAFAAPSGTRLDAGATYLVVLEHTSYVRVESTHSSAQDAGGASGWTIDGVGAGNSSPYSYGTSDSLLMSVNGTTARAQRAVREEEQGVVEEEEQEEQEEQEEPDPDRGISLSTSSSSAIEGEAVTIGVRRAGPTDRTTTVAVQVLDSALTDVWPIDVELRSGVATATATVAIPFDSARPASRTVTVSLASVEDPYSVGSPSTLTFNVTERDAALDVHDARVSEGPGATLAFAVTLDRTRDREVRVKYATSDGTATQGEDYTGVSGTLRFAPGETTKTVSVPVLDDAHDEGSETLTLRLSTARRAVIDDATAVGTIVNSDPMPNAWLSRFGRAASDHVVQSIGRRLEGGESESHLTVMGWRVDTLLESTHSERDAREPRTDAPGRQPEGSVRAPDGRIGAAGAMAGGTRGFGAMFDPGAARPAFDGAMTQGLPPMQGGTLQSPARAMGASDNRWLDLLGRLLMSLGPNGGEALATPGLRDMVMGSSFYYGYSPDAGPLRSMNRLTAWGESASTRFSGAEGKLSLDGEVNTAIVGADGEWGRWLAGLALSYSEGEGGYRRVSAKGGAVSSTLTGINPYARYRLDERTSFWATLGYGSGRLTLTPDGAESALETDMTNAMAAFGGRGVLSMRAGDTGQFELALRSDAMLTDTASMAVPGLSAGAGATSRIRLILEGSGALPAFGGVLAPKVEAGLRYDGGDAETGAGLEVGGGLAYDMARLTVQVDGRVLLTHRDRDYEEWGYSLSFEYKPASDGRGLRYQAGSQWGATQSGVQSLWSLQNAGGLANGARTASGQRYTAELGYGFGVGRLWYPYVATESGGASSQALRFGLNLNAGSALEAGLEIGRRAHLSGQIENEIRLQWQARW